MRPSAAAPIPAWFDARIASKACGARPWRRPSLRSNAGRNARADRAAHAGAAEPAIARRVLGQILLVIVLGEVERRRVDDLGRDRIEAALLERLLVHCLRGLGRLTLRGAEHVDAGAILRADVIALTHALRGIVVLPEGLEQSLIGDLAWIVDHQHDLVMAGAPAADLLISRIGRVTSRIAHRGDVDALAQLPELALGAPEAAHAEYGFRIALRIRAFERVAVEEMGASGRDRTRSARESVGGGRYFELLVAQTEHGESPVIAAPNIGWPRSPRIATKDLPA